MEVPLYLCGLVQFCYPGESDCGGATVPLWSGAVLLSDLKVCMVNPVWLRVLFGEFSVHCLY